MRQPFVRQFTRSQHGMHSGPYRGETIALDFAGQRTEVLGDQGSTFDELITFTRGSAGWYWDRDGVLQEAASGESRFDHDPATGIALGLLVEEQRTNSLLDNRDLSTGNWTNSAALAKDAIGIDGVANSAHTLTDNDAGNFQRLRQDVTIADDSNTHATSWFIKKDNDESRFPEFRANCTGGTTVLTYRVQLNTKTGAIDPLSSATSSDVSVKDCGDWWRVTLLSTNNSTGNTVLRVDIYPAAASTFGNLEASATGSIVYDFGQVELNASFATSPIETGGSTVTRNADDASQSLPSELADGFVWVVHARTPPGDANQYFGEINDGSLSESVILRETNIGDINLRVETGGSVDQLFFPALSSNTNFKVALKADASGCRMSVNGGSVSSLSLSVPSGMNTKIIGGSSEWNSTISSDTMYANPENFSDADLQALSS